MRRDLLAPLEAGGIVSARRKHVERLSRTEVRQKLIFVSLSRKRRHSQTFSRGGSGQEKCHGPPRLETDVLNLGKKAYRSMTMNA